MHPEHIFSKCGKLIDWLTQIHIYLAFVFFIVTSLWTPYKGTIIEDCRRSMKNNMYLVIQNRFGTSKEHYYLLLNLGVSFCNSLNFLIGSLICMLMKSPFFVTSSVGLLFLKKTLINATSCKVSSIYHSWLHAHQTFLSSATTILPAITIIPFNFIVMANKVYRYAQLFSS